MDKMRLLTGLLCLVLSGRTFGQDPTTGNPPPPREYPGLKQTQLALTLAKDLGESRFRATAVARGKDALMIITAAHCVSPRDVGRSVQVGSGEMTLKGQVASVVQNPVYRNTPNPIGASGDDCAVAILKLNLSDPEEVEAFQAIQPAEATPSLIAGPFGQTVMVFVRDQTGREYGFRAGNYSNPRWLEWGPVFGAKPGDSGSGVFVYRKTPQGQVRPILVGVLSTGDRRRREGSATLISTRDRWLREALATELP